MMNPMDGAILTILEKDARIAHSDIAKQLGVAESEVKKAIANLEEKGAILRYTTVTDEEALDETPQVVRAVVEVSIRPEKKTGFETLARRICRYPEVVAHYLVSGQYDFLVVVEGRNHQEIASFIYEKLATIENVTGTNTHFILRKYKEHGVMIQKPSAPERMAIVA